LLSGRLQLNEMTGPALPDANSPIRIRVASSATLVEPFPQDGCDAAGTAA
jgi:hypothetical protein